MKKLVFIAATLFVTGLMSCGKGSSACIGNNYSISCDSDSIADVDSLDEPIDSIVCPD